MREREKEGKRARKRQGLVVLGSGEENPRVLLGDADQESETRMRKNALRTGRRQAVEKRSLLHFQSEVLRWYISYVMRLTSPCRMDHLRLCDDFDFVFVFYERTELSK
ncbi:hypothetical protein TNCV_4423161 [Trichonephila clavipes]|nr:hypothetical protein TNCV_4423161 [Trichonephila clavipes]